MAAARIDPIAKREELARLHAETHALLDWYIKYQNFSIGPEIKKAVDKAFEKGRLGDMRSIAREMRGFVTALPPDLRAELLASVDAESGVSLRGSDAADDREAEAVLQRGKIRNDREYYLVREHVERLSNDPLREDGVRSALSVLDSYRPRSVNGPNDR